MESSSPSKVILFGEHAVVYGEPAIAMAIDLKTTVKLEVERFTISERSLDHKFYSYLKKAMELYWRGPKLVINASSKVPPASGLGSSASITVAMISSILAMQNKWNKESIAEKGFEVEYQVQGRASPTDTSAITAGGAILISNKKTENLLWEIKKNEITWYINSLGIKPLSLVIGVSKYRGITSNMVGKVRRFVTWSGFGKDIIKEIGRITVSAIRPLEEGDYETVGSLMNQNDNLLTVLGVNHPKVKEMTEKLRKCSYGAKMTGAGGGGSIIALTDEKDEVIKILRDHGWFAYYVNMDREGVKVLH